MNRDSSIKIEKGIPMPPKRNEGVTAALREMKVGDSFLINSRKPLGSQVIKNLGIKITTRSEGDKIRVWRIK